ncbi:MAG: glutathione synthetase [Paludibacteraceae bacterium]|nr:glutathione synthetase [Paludibacteraceae bacterium]
MAISEIIGLAAGACMAFSQFPQAYLVYKTKDTHSISLLMFSILTAGVALWFVCGIVTRFWPMWLSNGICLLPSLYVLYMTVKNKYFKP